MPEPTFVRTPPPYRLAASAGLVLALLGAFLHYVTRDPRPRNDASVISYLETVGPFWPILFGTAAALVALSFLLRGTRLLAHTYAAGVLAAYAFALFWTAAATGSGWVTACFAVALAVHTTALATAYANHPEVGTWTQHSSARSSPASPDW